MAHLVTLDDESSKFIKPNIVDVRGFTFNDSILEILEQIENFEVYDDDIWICTYPKSGTTWTQEMVWMIAHDFDYESAKVDNEIRMPFIDFAGYLPGFLAKHVGKELEYITNSIEFAKNVKRPRILKAHLPFVFLPKQIQNFEKNPKIIHVYRNLKDVCVSFYHHQKLFSAFWGKFEHFWKLFLSNKIIYTPMVDFVQSYWQHKDKKNILILRYEDMVSDLKQVILKVGIFLNKSIPENEMGKLLEHLSFDSMKKNPYFDKHVIVQFSSKLGAAAGMSATNDGSFFRKGKSDAYQNDITPEIERVFDEYLKQKLVNTNLQL